MEPGLVIFLSLVALSGLGLLWFHVLRPMLEAFGVLPVGEYSVSNVFTAIDEDHERVSTEKASNVSVNSIEDDATDEQTDEQTDVGPSALSEAINERRLNIVRALIIDTLVQDGADVALVRSLLKGDNATIGTEVAESRERLGIKGNGRLILVRDSNGQRKIAI